MEHSLETQIAEWRAKALSGSMSMEEMKAAVAVIRQNRPQAAQRSESSKARKATANKSVDTAALFDELENL